MASGINTAPVFSSGRSGRIDESQYGTGQLLNDIAIRPDGKLVAIGNGLIYRFNSDGTGDTSFGYSGARANGLGDIGEIGWLDFEKKITLLADDKILITGTTRIDPYGFDNGLFLARLNADGSVDTTFKGGGKVINPGENTSERLVGTVILDDGRILVAAASSEIVGNGTSVSDPQHISLARYLADGTPDPGFGINGISVGGNSHARPSSMVVQADGKILVVATDTNSKDGYYSFMLFRYNSDGTPDKNFGTGGLLTTSFVSSTYNKSAHGMNVAVQADGKIVAVGSAPPSTSDPRMQSGFAVVRYNSDGTLDKTFSGDGKFHEFIWPDNGQWRPKDDNSWGSNSARDLHIGDDGSILVAGITFKGQFYVGSEIQTAIIRLRGDGSLDTTFGTNGYVTTPAAPGKAANHIDFANVVVDPDGTIVIGGGTNVPELGVQVFMARFKADGTVDNTFGMSVAGAQNSVAYLPGHPDQFLNAAVMIEDADVDDLNGSSYAGAHVTLARLGGANSQDDFVAGGALRFEDGRVLIGEVDIGSVDTGIGTLRIDFNENASQARVNQALQSIAYENKDHAQTPRQISIDWTFSDGLASAKFSTVLATQAVELPYWVDALLDRRSAGQTAEQLRQALQSFLGIDKGLAVKFDGSGSGVFSPAQRGLIDQVLNEVESSVGINFGVIGATLSIKNSTELAVGEGAATPLSRNGAGAYFALQEDSAIFENSGVVLHALGHALGLKDGSKPSANGSMLPLDELASSNTVMGGGGVTGSSGAYRAFGDVDIAALQYLYGPNKSTRPGDDIYRLSADDSNFIWDGAGSDTVSGEEVTADLTLHLEPGYWDYIGDKDRVITGAGQITVNYGSVIENAIGGSGNDRISGTAKANTLTGGAGNDRLEGLGGNDHLDGGLGIDTAAFSGNRSTYTIRQDAAGFTVTDRAGNGGTDTLLNAERIQFGDGMLAIDLDGSAGHAYRLYKAVFGREPDAAGLGYWIAAMDKGMTADNVAKLFMTSPEFATQYGAQPDSTKLITTLYKNVLHRDPDVGGFEWWRGLLDKGTITASDALLGFSESVENRAQVIGEIENGIAFLPFYG